MRFARGFAFMVALGVTLALGACVSAKPGGASAGSVVAENMVTPAPTKASADSKIASGLNKIDAGIANASAKILAACSGARLVMTGVAFYAINKAKWQQPINVANATINSICSGPPPSDIPGALRTIADAVGSAIAASQAARADPTTS